MNTFFCDDAKIKKLIVTGLPRSGTTSVAKALEILGFKVMHHCIYTNPSGGLSEKVLPAVNEFLRENGSRAVVSHTLHPYMGALSNLPIIYLDRPINEVQESLIAIGHNPNDLKYYDQPVPTGAIKISTKDLSWHSLCEVINEPIPSTPFPRTNTRYSILL